MGGQRIVVEKAKRKAERKKTPGKYLGRSKRRSYVIDHPVTHVLGAAQEAVTGEVTETETVQETEIAPETETVIVIDVTRGPTILIDQEIVKGIEIENVMAREGEAPTVKGSGAGAALLEKSAESAN